MLFEPRPPRNCGRRNKFWRFDHRIKYQFKFTATNYRTFVQKKLHLHPCPVPTAAAYFFSTTLIFGIAKDSTAILTTAPATDGVCGPIAQLVEQWIENSRVPGSNPGRATIPPHRKYAPLTHFESGTGDSCPNDEARRAPEVPLVSFQVNPKPKKTTHPDLEIKDAPLIFQRVWKSLEDIEGRENLRFPKELILLGGAPGSGKGTNTDFIRKVRGISAQPIVISHLLNSPEAKKIKARGGMVGDEEVLRLLLKELLKPEFRDSAVLDGFPRTDVQVECLKMFYDHMVRLRREFSGTPQAHFFRQPVFHIILLFVDETESIARQLQRGREVLARNAEVLTSGSGTLEEERATDFDETLARKRYQTFKEKTYDALVSLKQIFHYHFINAQTSVAVVQQNIIRELEYQSSLELDPRTYDALRLIPLADEIVLQARQDLVNRLDSYEVEHRTLLLSIVEFVQEKMMPVIKRYAVTGRATVNTETELFHNPIALAILIDIFSERGFQAMVDIHKQEIPERFDLQTGKIETRQKKVYRITVFFSGSKIRRG